MDTLGGGDADGMGFEMPMVINQPPRIFGAYNPDGSPIPPSLPGPLFSDSQMAGGNLDDSNDAKRRRIARVCPCEKCHWVE